jgi:regulator of sigma E protease
LSILSYPLAFIGVLGVLVVIHEFGHFAMAKLLGVRVEAFSIGFGPRLFGTRRGETDYKVCAIPLGGYVKMSGENPMDEHSNDPREFMSHPRWHRFLIAIAGPAMNIALAIGLLTAINMFHYSRPAIFDQLAVIGYVEEDSAAAKAGLQQGDRITLIDGIQDPTWEQTLYKELLSPGHALPLAVQRGKQTIEVSLTPVPKGLDRQGYAGWYPDEAVVVTQVEKEMPAAKAGVQPGDEVTSADGHPVRSWPAMISYLQKQKGQPLQLTVLRHGQPVQLQMQPTLADVPGISQKHYRVGIIHSNALNVQKLPFGLALDKSLEENRKSSFLALELIEKLIQRRVSMRQIDGPLRIAQVAGEAVQEKGWFPTLDLTWRISLQLGIFNLLPIPILDGGVILLLLIEGLIQRDINLVVKERIYQAAFVFLVVFASMVIFNDISKLLRL